MLNLQFDWLIKILLSDAKNSKYGIWILFTMICWILILLLITQKYWSAIYFITEYCSNYARNSLYWIWILLQCIAQGYWYAETRFCYLLHWDIDLLNLQFVFLMGILFEVPKKIHHTESGFYHDVLHKDVYLLNLDFVMCYMEILICWICN